MKKFLFVAGLALALLATGSCSRYKTVSGDPLETKIYTLDNGLKIYMSVNKETPRIQTYIAVHSGGKNDPADNTGLAHYLEHIMFKGTQLAGTQDYEAENPMLEQIQKLYDVYRTKTDPEERAAIYHQIDSISYEASKIAIPNEYDKMMAAIGAQGSNAFTSDDVTCYTENIPSNQIENWAKVQADRFKNMVVRGFHTELEAVYEEYNRGLTSGSEKALDAADAILFKNHPYGTQTVIGTQDHLKNPDISAILRQKATYYVPNNTAICVAGDFDPKEMVAIIEKYFGDWEPNPDLPKFEFAAEEPLTEPVETDVIGNDPDFTMIAWRTPGTSSLESDVAEIASSILYNGMAGLIDLDVVQQQKLLEAEAMNYDLVDYGEMILIGVPLEGQDLKEVRDILLAEVARLREGDFDDDLVKATVNNFKLSQMRQLQSNSSRAMQYVNSFISGKPWKDDARKLSRMEKISKKDVVAWAGKYLADNNYVVVYKHEGNDPDIKKIEAPKITPIVTNRDKQSDFLKSFLASEVAPIEPVFPDFTKDMSIFETGDGIEVLYKKNELNDIASLSYRYETGTEASPALSFAMDYISYLGTPTRSAEEIASEMYKLACNFRPFASGNQSGISFSGLDENLPQAMEIAEDLIFNAIPDESILESLKASALKNRADAKLSQRACLSALRNYLVYGPEHIARTTMSNEQIQALTSEELLAAVRELYVKDHRILYYGPESENGLRETLAGNHKVAPEREKLVASHPVMQLTPVSKVYVAPFTARQFNYIQFSNRGESFDPSAAAEVSLFNEYFGGGMNGVVFQEMRESRALAYSAGASLASPSWEGDVYSFSASIGSQNDKLAKAVTAFDEIINDMPVSENALSIALSSIESRLRTQRTTGEAVLQSYLSCERLGIPEPASREIFEALPSMGMDDLKAAQQKWIKGRTYVYGILGDTADLDMNFLRSLGPVQVLSLEEIFGY